MGNWKVTAWLSSPLAGEPPMLDAILEWELSARLGYKHHNKLTRDIPLSELQKPPIPVSQRTINDVDVYCCSSPIIPVPDSEFVERLSKRIDTSEVSLMLAPENRKSLLVASGPYKMRYVPERIRLVPCVCWFIRGDRKGINKLLKSIYAIGKRRNVGYGIVNKWEFEDMGDNDYSIFALRQGKKVLMRPVHCGYALDHVTGYKKTYGAPCTPYWHPDNYMEIATPC